MIKSFKEVSKKGLVSPHIDGVYPYFARLMGKIAKEKGEGGGCVLIVCTLKKSTYVFVKKNQSLPMDAERLIRCKMWSPLYNI